MKHDETNFDSIQPIDPELEARVVAWVLGEASPFEAAELERRCAERLELAEFKREMEAVHGLLGEAARPAGAAWRLAPERRAALLEKLNEGAGGAEASASERAAVEDGGKVVALPAAERKAKAWRAWVLPVAACVALGGLLAAIVLPTVGTVSHVFSAATGSEPRRRYLGEASGDSLLPQGVHEESKPVVYELAVGESGQGQGLGVGTGGATDASARVQFNLSSQRGGPMGDREANKPGRPASDSFAAKRAPAVTAAPAPASARPAAPASAPVAASGPVARGQGILATDGTELAEFKDRQLAAEDKKQLAKEMSEERTLSWDGKNAFGDASSFAGGAGSESLFSKKAEQVADADHAYGRNASEAMTQPVGGDFSGMTIVSGGALEIDSVYTRTESQSGVRSNVAQNAGRLAGVSEEVRRRGALRNGWADAAEPSSAATSDDAGLVFFDATRAGTVADASLGLADAKVPALKGDLLSAADRVSQVQASTGLAELEKSKSSRELVAFNEGLKDLPLEKPASLTPAFDEALRAEVATQAEAVSTFSLHVGDVSFRLAKAALERGVAPDPATIRPEEFYNAFDYGDPAPAAGEPVACRVEQAAHPFLQQRNLVRIALRVPAAGRGAGTPLNLTVLLDTSGSMEREDRAATVRAALGSLAALLGPDDRVTLVGFARQPRLLVEGLAGDQAAQLAELAARTPAEGGTNLEEALKVAGELARRQLRAGAQNRIVLLTDGAANLGDADPARLAEQVEALRRQGVAFDACGVGADGLDDGVLEALTRKGDGRYQVLNSPEEADVGFARKLAGAFRPAAENVKVQVRFNPARVARYRLIGFEQHRLREQDFKDDRVDAAELAAEEAAVALYQVEVIPGGEGELGDVAVRFRDTARGGMVERTWTLTYEAQPPAFDRAPASLRLAGAAALLAEKLRGGALAGQIRLDELAPVVAGLRGAYAGDARVENFLRMFDQARRLTGE